MALCDLALVPTIGLAALVLAALVAVIGSAQAAPSTKFYTAGVHPTTVAAGTTSAQVDAQAHERLDEHPDARDRRTSLRPPAGQSTSPSSGNTQNVPSDEGKSWTVKNASNTVEFRANSSQALNPGHSVSANVNVDVPCTASGPATWTTKAKQSNTFNGPPGNEVTRLGDDPTVTVTQGGGSLGGFAFDTVPEPGDQRPLHRHSHRKGCLRLHADDVWGRRDAFRHARRGAFVGTFGTWSSGVATRASQRPPRKPAQS